ncbi:MAG: LysR family transcriptional regulator [Syntrophomonadaceae bacterium]|nr:LysR family transcriptional regulator [Syntrophomonadaceae bacterium]
MHIQQMRYFCTAARSENLTKAAQRLFITQPALTKSIRALEAELGVTLFRRNGASLTLNAAGKQTFDRFSRILQELDLLEADLQKHRLPSDRISVCSAILLCSQYLLAEYILKEPNTLNTFFRPDNEVEAKVLFDQEADLLISYHPIQAADVTCITLFEDELLLRLPVTIPIASTDPVDLSLFQHEKFVIVKLDQPVQQIVLSLLELHHIPLQNREFVQDELPNVHLLPYYVQLENAICFTTVMAASYLDFRHYQVTRIQGSQTVIPYYVSYLTYKRPAVAPLIDWMRKRHQLAIQKVESLRSTAP